MNGLVANMNEGRGQIALQKLLDQYLHFEVSGKVVPIPYVLDLARFEFWRSSGKGTPEVLRSELETRAKSLDFNFKVASEYEIFDFMRQSKIGVECSGFVFHLLDAYLRAAKGLQLSDVLVRYEGIIGQIEKRLLSWQRYRRINAATLTSGLNTITIDRLSEIKVADLIRVSRRNIADHVLIVIKVELNLENRIEKIIYAHSSGKSTQKNGPHIGEIRVVDQNAPISNQDWLEKTATGDSYKSYFHPDLGDGVRRLKVLCDN